MRGQRVQLVGTVVEELGQRVGDVIYGGADVMRPLSVKSLSSGGYVPLRHVGAGAVLLSAAGSASSCRRRLASPAAAGRAPQYAVHPFEFLLRLLGFGLELLLLIGT